MEIYSKDHNRISEELYEAESNPTALAEDEVKAEEYENDMRAANLDCEMLVSKKTIFANTLALESAVRCITTAYDANPESEHKVTLELVLTRAKTSIHTHFWQRSEAEVPRSA